MGHPPVRGRDRSQNNTVSSPRGSAKPVVNFTERRTRGSLRASWQETRVREMAKKYALTH